MAWPANVKIGDTGHEVALAQSVLNEVNNAGLLVDGDFGNGTKTAVVAFQNGNGLGADGIVGPMTWGKLFENANRYVVRFKKGPAPANDPATTENDALYECEVKIDRIQSSGMSQLATYRGSIIPDNMDVKGYVKNGWYRLHLGFHRRSDADGNPLTPTANDLVVKTSGTLRPCLVVNQDADVPVTSNDPNKTTSTAIHIHNGFNTERGSDGCQTITPSNWSDFIKHYLDSYTSLSDWHENSSYRGKDIGVMIIE